MQSNKPLKICLISLCLLCYFSTVGLPQIDGATFCMKKIPLTRGLFALVDDEDFEYLNQWIWCLKGDRKRNTLYCHRAIRLENGKWSTLVMHREIMKPEKDKVVDHIDHDGLNNQRNNLRIVTKAQNRHNSLPNRNSSSKYLGVHWNARQNKWCASIKEKSLGYFKSE